MAEDVTPMGTGALFVLSTIGFSFAADSYFHYVGCRGIDSIVYKYPSYKPDKCLLSCAKKGINRVSLGAGQWCGCGGPMQPAPTASSEECMQCFLMPSPLCNCYEGSYEKYYDHVADGVFEMLEKMAQPKRIRGYSCPYAPSWENAEKEWSKGALERAHQCMRKKCIPMGYRYGAYHTPLVCGCLPPGTDKEVYWRKDRLGAITKSCMDRILCMETIHSSCMCGNELFPAHNWGFRSRLGPLLKTDKLWCYLGSKYTNTKRYRSKLRRRICYLHSASGCIKMCKRRKKKFAAVYSGRCCTCVDSPEYAGDIFMDVDCHMPCQQNLEETCGGQYSASLFSTDDIDLSLPNTADESPQNEADESPQNGADESPQNEADESPQNEGQADGALEDEGQADGALEDEEYDDGVGVTYGQVLVLGGSAVGIIILTIIFIM